MIHNFHPSYRADIDGLRAVAILSVVAVHAFPTGLPGGFIGVDVFFVISGFLISTIIFNSLRAGRFDFAEFYARRVRRIFPALALVLVATYAIGWATLLPDEFVRLGKHMAAGAGFAVNFTLMGEAGYFDPASELKPLMHLWSLSVEEQFYLFFPPLVWLAWRRRWRVGLVVAICALGSVALGMALLDHDAVRAFFAPDTRIWELLVGSLAAFACNTGGDGLARLMSRRIGPVRLRDLASLLGLTLIAGAAMLLDRETPYPGWRAMPPVGGAALLILAGPDGWANRRLLACRPMVFVGLISYPLYLWHWPLISFTRITEYGIPSRAIRAAAVMTSMVLAWLTCRFVERPFRQGRATGAKPILLTCLVAALGLAGYATYRSDGLPWRHEEAARRNAQFDWPFNVVEDCEVPGLSGQCIGDTRSPTVVLLGDSHSNALYPGLAEETGRRGMTVLNLASNGCLPFPGVTAFQRGEAPGTGCTTFSENAVRFVEGTASVTTVVVASRGPLHLTGKGFGSVEQFHDRGIALVGHPEVKEFDTVFRIGMRALIDRLVRSGKKVVFVIDVAELGFDAKSCISTRPFRVSPLTRSPCAVPRSEYDQRNSPYRALVASVLRDFPMVVPVDAAALLCDESYCWGMRDGQVLYRDDDHLALAGSRMIGARLAEMLAPR